MWVGLSVLQIKTYIVVRFKIKYFKCLEKILRDQTLHMITSTELSVYSAPKFNGILFKE